MAPLWILGIVWVICGTISVSLMVWSARQDRQEGNAQGTDELAKYICIFFLLGPVGLLIMVPYFIASWATSPKK